jgi:hypothetical protein
MRCISDEELVKAELGDLTLNEVAHIDEHAAQCSRCVNERNRIRQHLADLASVPELPDADRFVGRVMAARCEEKAATKNPRRLFLRMTSLHLVAAAATVFLTVGVTTIIMHDRSPKETWSPRGSGNEAKVPRRTVEAEVLVIRENQLLPLSEQVLGPSDAFAVRYLNPTSQPRYLMAFAVDAAGDVHWLFPEYLDETTDPQSIPLPLTEREQLLPQVIEPDDPAPGPMQVVTMTSQEPVTVKQVEAALRDAPAGMSVRAVLARLVPHALLREWSCSWNVR